MSDVIYVESNNGLNVSINELETEISPEGYIFVRNGEKEIDSYLQNIIKPDLDVYSQNKQNDIENTINVQVDAAVTQLRDFTNSECQNYVSQTCLDKKDEITQFAEQSKNEYATFVNEKNQEVENLVSQANDAAESASSSKNAAASSATSSSNYSNNSKIWAEGEDSQVQALGGTHSAKGWANLVNDSVLVHKTGNETIAGEKTFTGNIIPSNILFKSKTGGANQGFINQNTNGNLYVGLKNSGNTEIMNNLLFAPDGSITVNFGNSATNKAFIIPTPATSDNSAKAATTNWVRSVCPTLTGGNSFTGINTVPTQSVSDNSTRIATTAFVNSFITNLSSTLGSGYVYVGNLLIQWGTWNEGTTTFPKPFANTNYGMAILGGYTANAADNWIKSASTTGFTAQKKTDRITKYITIGQRG